MQAGLGFSKILILVGAGYTGSVMLKNGRLSDVLGELQSLIKGLEKSGDSSKDSDYSEALAAQVRRLAMEVRQLASSHQITVLNGDSSQIGSLGTLAMPAAALGALGYGYMWWKGLSLADLMYVTKHNMAKAVSGMTKHLEQVSAALAATKRHLTQRIENLDGKLDEQKEMSKLIKNDVTNVRADLCQIGYDLDSLQKMVAGLDGKICTLEDKQDYANVGVWYLLNFVGSKDKKVAQLLQDFPKPANKPRGFLGSSETLSLKDLKQIADSTVSDNIDKLMTNDGVDKFNQTPRSLTRIASIKC